MDYATFIEQHYQRLYDYAVYRCFGNQEVAQDLLQHVLWLVSEGRVKVDWDRYPLTYLQMVIQREVRSLDEPYLECDNNDTVCPLWQDSEPHDPRLETLDKWIADLPNTQQVVVRMVMDAGDFQVVAERMGRRTQDVRDCYNRALIGLRRRAKYGV